MIWPFLMLIGMGRFIWLPVPVLLLWPFILALLIVTAPLSVLPGDTCAGKLPRFVWRISGFFAAMNATRIRVDPVEGPRIRVIVI